MLYDETIRVFDGTNGDDKLATPIELSAGTGVIYTKSPRVPGVVRSFGFIPAAADAFDYDTPTTLGVLTLYRYPKGVEGNKVALGTIKLEDDAEVGSLYYVDVPNLVPDTNPAQVAPAKYQPGDQLVIKITTQAAGGGYLDGSYHPVIFVHNRGESPWNEAKVFDRTPAIVGS